MKDIVYQKSALDMALELADTHGWHVFPVSVEVQPDGKSKKIALINWGSEASNDPEAIEAMLTSKKGKPAWQYATHVGVACGPSRVWVVDEDKPGAAGEISGHYHPKAVVPTRGRSVSRPCFLYDASRVILPAFGTYTGGLRCHDPVLTSLMLPGARAVLTGRQALEIPMPRRSA